MELDTQIHDAFLRFGKMVTRASQNFEAVIVDVDTDNFTCTVNNSFNNADGTSQNVYIYNVPLKVLIGSQASLIEIPAVGSDCIVCFKDNNIQRPQLLSVDKCDSVIVAIGKTILNIDTNGFKLNNDTKGLKKTLQDLINELIAFKVVTPAGEGTTDPSTVTNLNTYLNDLDDYLTD